MLANDRAIVGKQIGHYQVLNRIGRGGMGEVFLAQDTRLGRKVALKLLRSDFTRNEERLRRFRQEAQAASSLNHPNILTIHEIGQEGSLHFMATEHVEGQTLREKISETRKALGQVLDITVQVAGALAAAHNAGIIHRDIKPENIMVRTDGYVKVLDFGLAKLTDPKPAHSESPTLVKVETEPGVVMGTCSYMSPEQARGLAVDARTDIWSLGVMLYEMVAGRQPFEGETASDVMSLILQREPPPLAHSWPEVPTELDRIVRKTLHKDKEERYQTIKDLLIDLRNLRKGLELDAEMQRSAAPMSVSPLTNNQSPAAATQYPSSAEYIVERLKQHKRVAVAAIALLLVASAVAAAAYLYSLGSGRATINSMAVLPFANDGADPDDC
jgi:serine/threonine protein kinase